MEKIKLENLKTKFIARNIAFYKELDSTQKQAKKLANENIKNGTIVITENQTHGIGTHGRTWQSNPAENATFTIILYPNCNIKNLENITTQIAQSICMAIKALYNIDLEIKKPNDLILNGKKIGGILTEIDTIGENVNELFIGIGFNVNQTEFNEELQNTATSLHLNNVKNAKVQDVICEICNKLEILIERIF